MHNKRPNFIYFWILTALFFLYQYVLRVYPGIFSEELKSQYHLTAEQFSRLGSYYLYAYSLLQIPLGLLIDRIGVKKMVASSLVICALGQFIFYYTQNYSFALVGRVMIGIGSAPALMSALKMITDFFQAKKKGLYMGLTLATGTLGVLLATKVLIYAANNFINQNEIAFYLGIVGLIFLVVVLVTPIPSVKQESKDFGLSQVWNDIKTALKSKPVMLYSFMAIALYSPLVTLADLWGTSFLLQKYNLPSNTAAQFSTLMYLGLTIGSIILPYLCEKNNYLEKGIRLSCFSIVILFALLLYGPAQIDHLYLKMLLVSIGVFCGAEMICFTGVSNYVNESNSGITFGVVNTLNMLGSAIFQQLIGYLLDFQWTGEIAANGLRLYHTDHFIMALSILLFVIVISLPLSFGLTRK